MRRVLFIQCRCLADVQLGADSAAGSAVEYVGCPNVGRADVLMSAESFDALLFPYTTNCSNCCDQLATLQCAHPSMPTVCVVEDGDFEAAAEVAEQPTADVFFRGQLMSDHAETMLESRIEQAAQRLRTSRLADDLERRNTELLGLNALASAVSSSLQRDVIVRRALWVFGGLCRQGAVAMVNIEPEPPLSDNYAEVPQQRTEPSADDRGLRCAGEFAVDGQPVCGPFDEVGRWLELIDDDQIVVVDGDLDADQLPGLDPLVGRLGGGSITLVPIWSQGRPLGLLIVADLSDHSRVPFTREALRAMASQLSGALENARLFEEVASAYRTLRDTQDQLVHAEKYAAMGVLAAEIAHEINNPASFVISNLTVMVDYVETIEAFLDELHGRVGRQNHRLAQAWATLAEDHEIEFLRTDLDSLLSRSLGGMQRIHQIVQDLRFFSHDSAEEPGWIDIENLLRSTINLVEHEAKYRAQLECSFGGVPQVFSDASRLSQVFLNLLVNAVHAIEAGALDDNRIEVITRHLDDRVVVTVSDTGEGISEDILPHIFEPFFTTKAKGEGTGLGLSISRDIIRSLGGDITVSSAQHQQGATFEVVVPIRASTFETTGDSMEDGSRTVPILVEEFPQDRRPGGQGRPDSADTKPSMDPPDTHVSPRDQIGKDR